ncbi:hypothetical protein RNZ50_13650 [Paracoccaceae bacterium Fryx2]|nr:hypothetical protein [Paracoccaceae bacterium Fryx2]
MSAAPVFGHILPATTCTPPNAPRGLRQVPDQQIAQPEDSRLGTAAALPGLWRMRARGTAALYCRAGPCLTGTAPAGRGGR